METCVAEIVSHDAERAKRHGARVRLLRENRGISKGRLLDALSLTTTNGYDLYERGVSVIRLDRLEDWAGAFEIPVLDFVSVVVLSEPDPLLVARAAEALGPDLVRQMPERPREIARVLEQHDPRLRDDALRQLADAMVEQAIQTKP
jgi:transcriptional regulator with XRE-family HTH domain